MTFISTHRDSQLLNDTSKLLTFQYLHSKAFSFNLQIVIGKELMNQILFRVIHLRDLLFLLSKLGLKV